MECQWTPKKQQKTPKHKPIGHFLVKPLFVIKMNTTRINQSFGYILENFFIQTEHWLGWFVRLKSLIRRLFLFYYRLILVIKAEKFYHFYKENVLIVWASLLYYCFFKIRRTFNEQKNSNVYYFSEKLFCIKRRYLTR